MKHNQGFLDNSIQLVRTLRMAQDLQLPEAELQEIEKTIHNKLNYAFNTSSLKNQENNKNEHNIHNIQELESELKASIGQNSPWSETKKIIVEIATCKPSSELSAYLIEVSLLFGGVQDAFNILDDLLKNEAAFFYDKIHAAVRKQLILYAWKKSKHENICMDLLKKINSNWLENHEKLILFIFTCIKNQYSLAWNFYELNQKILYKAAEDFSETIDINPSKLSTYALKIASQLGRVEEAFEIFKKIPRESQEYHQSFKLILQLGNHENFFQGSYFHTRLVQANTWESRLRLFKNYLHEASSKEHPKHKDLLALNHLLKDPLTWFPKEPHIWEKLSRLICNNLSLIDTLPNIITLYKANAFSLNDMELDLAIWRPIIENEIPLNLPKPLVAIAKVHYFLNATSDLNDQVIFSAKELMTSIPLNQRPSEMVYYSWESVCGWIKNKISENKEIPHIHKEKLLTLVQSADIEAHLTIEKIESYLNITDSRPTIYALKEFIKYAKNSGSRKLELRCIMKYKESYLNYTNSDIKRIWHLAVKQNKDDLAWRSITVLKSRIQIPESINTGWKCSGEQKRSYPLHTPNALQIDACLQGFNREEVRLIWTCMKLGEHIPLLLSHRNQEIKIGKKSRNTKDPIKAKISEILETKKLFGKLYKDYSISHAKEFQGLEIPMFSDIILDNTWCKILQEISHRMGISAWKWQVSVLTQLINTLSPSSKTSWQPFQSENAPIAKWLKILSSEQRSSWYDLSQIINKLDDEQGFRILSCFMTRLSTLIYQNHFQALYSLKKMRAPIYLIWDLENWILSSKYNEMRRDYQWENTFKVPHSLYSDPILGS